MKYSFFVYNFCNLFLLISAVFTHNISTKQRKWVCYETNCLPESDENVEILSKYNLPFFDSQDNCRLSCGRYGALWPHPTMECVISHDRRYFDLKNMTFNLQSFSDDNSLKELFLEMKTIFLENIGKEHKKDYSAKDGSAVEIDVFIESNRLKLDWNTDEAYSLKTKNFGTNVGVNIKASTIFGVRHALETLSQLIIENINGGLIIASSARIRDKPFYKHRGLLLDTARNFIPIENIKKTLSGMGTTKMNVFHWHITDSHSFPLEMSRVPALTAFGAYSPKHVYSRSAVKDIIHYAKVHGIRVIIEFDGPSHAGNGWQFGPEVGLGNLAVCINKQPWRKFCIQPPCGQLNPLNPNLYYILKKIFEDIIELINPGETMHLGGDEVFIGCWNSTKEIVDLLLQKGYDTSTETYLQLWSEFHKKSLEIWRAVQNEFRVYGEDQDDLHKSVILWSSHLTDPNVIEKYLSKSDYIIQTWVEAENSLTQELVQKGYKIICSTKNAWYLDHGFWGLTQYHGWRKVYDNQIGNNTSILGGEVCMWSEYVDENSLDSRIWPRAGAVGERLWTNPSTSSAHAEQRFNSFRKKLISRGLNPDAITPKWCDLHEGECV